MGSRSKEQRARRTGWHPGFAQLAIERRPGNFEVLSEVQLSQDPRRADLLLVRRIGEAAGRSAQTLRGLWPLIPRVGLVEFKSPSHGFRRGDLMKLYSYGFHYLERHRDEFSSPRELVLVLVNPSITPTLRDEVAFLEGTIEPLGNGYARVADAVEWLQTIIVSTDEVAEAENDACLSIFSHKDMDDPEAVHWFRQWLAQEVTIMGDPAEIKDFDDMWNKLLHMLPLEKRLEGLSIEERLAGLSSDERLAGLSRAELEQLIAKARRLVDEAE